MGFYFLNCTTVGEYHVGVTTLTVTPGSKLTYDVYISIAVIPVRFAQRFVVTAGDDLIKEL